MRDSIRLPDIVRSYASSALHGARIAAVGLLFTAMSTSEAVAPRYVRLQTFLQDNCSSGSILGFEQRSVSNLVDPLDHGKTLYEYEVRIDRKEDCNKSVPLIAQLDESEAEYALEYLTDLTLNIEGVKLIGSEAYTSVLFGK